MTSPDSRVAAARGPLPAVARSDRLVLPLWTAADVAGIRGTGPRGAGWHPGFPREDDVDAASMWREGDPWGPRSIVRGSTVLGSIGFFGPPQPVAPPGEAGEGPTETEVGYGLVREAWGWGFATEALRALTTLVDEACGGQVRLRACVRPENKASLRVLAKTGFTGLRGTTAEGELVMVRPAPGLPA